VNTIKKVIEIKKNDVHEMSRLSRLLMTFWMVMQKYKIIAESIKTYAYGPDYILYQ
jgi:hypothetical protein